MPRILGGAALYLPCTLERTSRIPRLHLCQRPRGGCPGGAQDLIAQGGPGGSSGFEAPSRTAAEMAARSSPVARPGVRTAAPDGRGAVISGTERP